MNQHDALLRELQKLSTKPDGPILRAMRVISLLREEVRLLREELEYLREYAKRRGWDCFKEDSK